MKTPLSNKPPLRLLVACNQCHRQYDASQRRSGERFLCVCGEPVMIPSAKAYQAAVIRCSSCAGVRSGTQDVCVYCGSEFTLREKDMHTVCPGCTARISDSAKFCHHCATPILPQGTAGELTDYVCPACGKPQALVSRALGDHRLSVLECGQCGGLWLDSRVFTLLEERAQTTATPGETFIYERYRGHGAQPTDNHGRFYRACPQCGNQMHRRNYGRRSGVLVDTCKQHGVWFDAGELKTILGWIKTGGLTKAKQWERQRVESDKRVKEFLTKIDNHRDRWTSKRPSTNKGSADVIGGILDYFLR